MLIYEENGMQNPGIIIKLNSEGQLEWQKYYKNNSNFSSVQSTKDGGFVVTGGITILDNLGNGTADYGGDKDELLVGVETNGTEYIAIGCVEDVQRDALVIKFTDFTDYENDNLVINDSIKQNSDSSTYNLNEEKSLSTTDIIVLVVGGIVIIVAIIIAIILTRKVLKY